jgi:hypothetical protein
MDAGISVSFSRSISFFIAVPERVEAGLYIWQ